MMDEWSVGRAAICTLRGVAKQLRRERFERQESPDRGICKRSQRDTNT